MSVEPEARLAALGITLPPPPPAAAAYLPVQRLGDLLYTAGQLALAEDGLVAEGRLGADVDLETGVRCARQCAVNILAQVRGELGALDRIRQVVKIVVFVASEPAFTQQHLVADGASKLLAEVLGEAGSHVRSAVGTTSLPRNSPVEVEAIVQVR